jgi:alpha-tubulin suppressor-like RCC1 family protein
VVPPNPGNVMGIAAGLRHGLGLRSDGTVIAWGRDNEGQCTVPAGLGNVVAVAAGDQSIALLESGSIVAWGGNQNGQFCIPQGLCNVTAISAGSNHNLAILQSGGVAAWGLIPDTMFGS